MARLPQPGGDAGNWGQILNDYLATAHNADGTLKSNSVGSSQLQTDSVTTSHLAPNAVTVTEIQDGTISEIKLATAVQNKLNSGGATNLTTDTTSTTVIVRSDTGTDATLSTATGSAAGILTGADKDKLDGVATGATANATNSQLRDRATHTGTQAVSTIDGLQGLLDAKSAAPTDSNVKASWNFTYTDTTVARPTVPAYVSLNWIGPAGIGGTPPENIIDGDTWDTTA